MIERWLVMKCPLFEEIYLFALASSYGIAVSTESGWGEMGIITWNWEDFYGILFTHAVQKQISDLEWLEKGDFLRVEVS